MAAIFMRFPLGKEKAVTLSYDDGVEQDIRLIEIMKKNRLKGTFNLNSGLYADEGTQYPKGTVHRRLSKSQAIELYGKSGMEVAVHGLTHPWLEKLSPAVCSYEIVQDRLNLEQEYGVLVRGMAYPFGTYSDTVVDILKNSGVMYARTVISSEKFDIPEDWLRLPATCHHNNPNLMKLAHDFIEKPCSGHPCLFYLWGHSYEFEMNDNWNVIEEFAEYVGNREDIWYATNIEICDYVNAFRQLIFSMDGSRIYNPTCKTLFFQRDQQIFSIKPGEII